LLVVFSLSLLLILSSCIAIPIKVPPGEKPFAKEFMALIKVGETTREQVRSYLDAAPSAPRLTRFDQDSTWVYHATRDTWQWLVCAGGPYMADCGVAGGVRDYFLMLQFDDHDTLIKMDSDSTLGKCAESRTCHVDDLIMVYASEARDHQVKAAKSMSECQLFVFSTSGWISSEHVIGIWLDEEMLGWLLDDDAFLFAPIRPGTHSLRTTQVATSLDDTAHGRHAQYLAFDCAAGDTVCLHHDSRHPDRKGRRFLLVEEACAAKQLAKRRLILRPVAPAENWQAAVSEQTIQVPGLSDDVVWRVQRELRALDLYLGDMDGEMNDETVSAIRAFKQQRGLPGDTLLDDNTLAVLGLYDD
jgi:hypothetical protein